MTSIPPTNPFHISRAYGLPAAAPARPVAPVGAPSPIEAAQSRAHDAGSSGDNLSRLVGATVPGSIDFSAAAAPGDVDADEPVSREAIPFYRHPADKIAAATAVNAGRLIDVRG